MTRILVTGATGNIGQMTIRHLLNRLPAAKIVGLAREPAKAANLAALGVEIRQGDYFDPKGLLRAFEGIDKIMLVSTTAFTARNTQHENVITAAKRAGVKHIVYMPIIHQADSSFNLPQVTEEDLFVESMLKSSGLVYTLVRHPPFLENLDLYVGGDAWVQGVRTPAGAGRAGYASREDLAEAHAVVLTETGHENKSYLLYGEPPVSFQDVAQIMSEISGKPVVYRTVSDKEYITNLMAAGLPELAAGFVLHWVQGVNEGEWDGRTGDLEKLIGRKPIAPYDSLSASHAARRIGAVS